MMADYVSRMNTKRNWQIPKGKIFRLVEKNADAATVLILAKPVFTSSFLAQPRPAQLIPGIMSFTLHTGLNEAQCCPWPNLAGEPTVAVLG